MNIISRISRMTNHPSEKGNDLLTTGRLNIVLMELDKITGEKADYDKQMAEQLKISSVSIFK